MDDQATVYGLTAWHDKRARKVWVVGTQRHQPVVGVFSLEAWKDGTVAAVFDHDSRAPTSHMGQNLWQESEEDALADFSPQFEGVVIDRTTGSLYAGQEDVGIWTVPVTGGEPVLAYETRGASSSSFFNADSVVTRDVEGLSIYYASSAPATFWPRARAARMASRLSPLTRRTTIALSRSTLGRPSSSLWARSGL